MIQIRLPIFKEKHFTDLLLERDLSNIEIEENKRLRKSWKIAKTGNKYTVFVPTPLYNAPTEIQNALLEWSSTLIGNKFKKRGLCSDKLSKLRDNEKLIFSHLNETSRLSNYPVHKNPTKKFRDTCGVKFDLASLFTDINDNWFENRVTSHLRWGQYGSRTSYHSQFNDEHGNTHHLITIAGIYNHPATPRYALESVLYHEMLHIDCPPIEGKTRRNVHHKEFRRRERLFDHYDQWQKWLKSDLHRFFSRSGR